LIAILILQNKLANAMQYQPAVAVAKRKTTKTLASAVGPRFTSTIKKNGGQQHAHNKVIGSSVNI
jgi:hypothetical protein